MRLRQLGANQTEITKIDGTVILFSYETPVACYYQDAWYRTNRTYSRTTTKHINAWLKGGPPAETVPQTWIDGLID